MTRRFLAVCLVSLEAGLCAQSAAPKSIPLKRVEFKAAAMRPGFDFAGR